MTFDVFGDLVEGFDALADARVGKIMLRAHEVPMAELVEVAQELEAGQSQSSGSSRRRWRGPPA
ncbi:hypothetical protein [Cupriavidus pauculus]|uniref:hypothetical protein n=1 Tax=Cupriavidus pauculus TaxID=82633 RepID=UPI001EE38901|nr:hypothetical protein [Cupriavidus pauculus]GJG95476.1 hypothetical protein CBA19C6_13325 [Cupriavidus pauculus]